MEIKRFLHAIALIPVHAASNPRFCGLELSPDRVFVGLAGTEFERERIDEPVTLRQPCQVTGVSDRALESAFKETFDVTPKAYITLMRLHGVRRTLCTAGPDELSVTDVAMRRALFTYSVFNIK